MGSNDSDADDDEQPVHEVCVDGFWMGKYEVTQSEWKRVMGSNPSHFKGNLKPVEQVFWNDAQQFIKRLNAKGNGTFRLPTEAEWEYAARSGGRNEKYSGGNDIDRVAWHGSNSGANMFTAIALIVVVAGTANRGTSGQPIAPCSFLLTRSRSLASVSSEPISF